MKRKIYLLAILLSTFSLFAENKLRELIGNNAYDMKKNVEEIKKIISNYSREFQFFFNEEIFELKLLEECRFIYPGYSLILVIWVHKKRNEIFMFYLVIKGDNVEKELGFNDPLKLSEIKNERFYKSNLFLQLKKFQILEYVAFKYDFNHDGNDDILSFTHDSVTGYIHFEIGVVDMWSECIRTAIDISCFPFFSFFPEFINYKYRQGLKYFDGEQFVFYYYDRIQQKYVQDENASSEELEQIHGSPDFFAETGIDYTKLERPLLPADLEGFSKAALRIWRNAVYARHGRTFRSEDLQALFNEYAWYKPDNEYTDDKLTDIDRANIKLIQEFEKK